MGWPARSSTRTEGLAGLAADGALEGDCSHLRACGRIVEVPQFRLDLFHREGRLPGSERYEGEAAQSLRTVTLIVVEVTPAGDQHPPPVCCQHLCRQPIRHGAGRQEERPLLAEEDGELLLEIGDDAAATP
jgi:hypothetical protein